MAQEVKQGIQEYLEKITQAIAESRNEVWDRLTGSASEIVDKLADKCGIDPEIMDNIVSYVSREVDNPDPEYQRETESKLDSLLQTIKDHVPEGNITEKLFDEWKQLTEKAGQGLKELQQSWNELSATIGNCEHERSESEKKLKQCNADIKEQKTLLEKANEVFDKYKDQVIDNPYIQEAIDKAKEAKEALEPAIEQLEQQLEKGKMALDEKLKELNEYKEQLKDKTLEINASSLVAALPKRVEEIFKNAAILETNHEKAQETKREVDDLSQKYQDLGLSYTNKRIQLGEFLQKIPGMTGLSDRLIDSGLNSLTNKNEKKFQSELETLNKTISSAAQKITKDYVVPAWHKNSNEAIDAKVKEAKDNLTKINQIEKKIYDTRNRAEQQAYRYVQRTLRDKHMSPSELKNSPEYAAKYKELTEKRLAGYQKDKEKVLEKFKQNNLDIKAAVQSREEQFKEFSKQVEGLENMIDMAKQFGDIHDEAQFTFSEDLKSILYESQELNNILDSQNQDAQEVINSIWNEQNNDKHDGQEKEQDQDKDDYEWDDRER